MESSQYMDRARQLLEGVRGKTLSIEERRESAMELSALILNEARRVQTRFEHRIQTQLDRMMTDPNGKVFTTTMTDECFRSHNPIRVADQLTYLLNKFGIPKFPTYFKQLQLLAFKWLGKTFPQILVPIARYLLRKETETMILPGERRRLARHMDRRRKEGVRVNLNHLGEAILGEEEAEKRLQTYLDDLSHPEVEYISVKISTICSQINLLSWENTVEILEERLKRLYRAAMQHTYVRPSGKCVQKFVNLDMEEYRDLHLTVEVFRHVLDNPEFYDLPAGIVLQSYLPDSYLIQQELTVWAMQRVANGGAPIKIRIVKGANLAMEQVEASLHMWPQAPYTNKADVDANFKRMVNYGCTLEHARAARIGIASHNLFDIAYALLIRSEMGIEKFVDFEMLEGMADHMRRVVQALSGGMLLYCPAATEKEFQHAVAYLVRRLDENTAPENFLRHLFGLFPETKEWQNQANQFSLACHAAKAVNHSSRRRTQNRNIELEMSSLSLPFSNEPETDWSLRQNRKWIENILQKWAKHDFEPVPLVIGGKEIPPGDQAGIGRDPACPDAEIYRYALADSSQIDKALQVAEKAQRKWAETPLEEKSDVFAKLAHLLRVHRGDLIGAIVADSGKTVSEADSEVSEAIDFVEYYRRNVEELNKMEDLRWQPKGTILVAPPWNFPCAIPLGGIVSALVCGNCVIFKPALEATYIGWEISKICWEAGIKKEVLQFLPCEDEPTGSQLIQDRRIAGVILTGATETAKMMLKLRPGLNLCAETGGKNAMIITSMADRDLAVSDLINSAFEHAGQKCSACSLAICEAEVYDDPNFRKTLRDAAASLRVGSAWNLATRVNPLIREPDETLMRGLTQLDEGEEWLLEPKQDPHNPNLWSPGIKLGVKGGSFTHQNELFGPVLAVMRADNLEHAVQLANSTYYGLTSGIQTLDEREQHYWIDHIEAGNCYINRGITGAVVQRQPFGGCKESSFGRGAKAGGPNYLMQLMNPEQTSLPTNNESVPGHVKMLRLQLEKMDISPEEVELWNASTGNYAYYWKRYFSKKHDPSLVVGQDNFHKYVPHARVVLRVNSQDNMIDVTRSIAAAMTCETPLQISGESEKLQNLSKGEWLKLAPDVEIVEETETQFIERVQTENIKRVRLLSSPSLKLNQVLAEVACNTMTAPVLANGRVELLYYLREISLSIDYHRYGNLGNRDKEERTPML
ncbi:MAG: 1-pyrroline-5-carboxylate dehydrogenase 1 [Chlamydiae bacterium]|nr:1-pyrroline-5-carboxylate dehydrogenase 1 [Chlamydiota bacterium]